MKAWHFLADTGLMRNGEPPPPDGEVLRWNGELIMCVSGLHASERAIDALKYAPGAVVCRVQLGGQIISLDTDKVVASERTILWKTDATNTLHEFACWCAEQALKLIDNPEPRSIAAIEAKRKWLKGEISDQDLAAAGDAARDAARAAAGDAARDAAWAAAGDAAWAAARYVDARAAQNTELTSMIEALK